MEHIPIEEIKSAESKDDKYSKNLGTNRGKEGQHKTLHE